jgi:NADH:ubiquinone oxidoreductase subunit 5 (subunit L)/multisubunit Na+/H+ antiporter MnhA subunit
LGNLIISFYHLVFHAFFKSLLFVNLGLFIIFNYSNQDFRIIKSLNLNKIFKISFFISCLNLIGLIRTLGFISKDIILISFFLNFNRYFLLFFLYIGCIFTGTYSIKFLFFFFKEKIKEIKIINNIFINFFFSKILLFSIFLNIIILLFRNLILIDLDFFIFKNSKILIYKILILSLINFKFLFFLINKKIFLFSVIIKILDLMNFIFYFLIKKISIFFILFVILEEYIFLNIFSKLSGKLLILKLRNFFKINIFIFFLLLVGLKTFRF